MVNRFFTTTFLLLACSVWIQLGFVTPCAASDKIKDLQALKQLGEEAIGSEVDFLATVTYVERVWSDIFVEANEEAIFIQNVSTKGLSIGDRVRVTGTVRKGDVSPTIWAHDIFKKGTGKTPDPLDIKISNLELHQYDSRYVRVQGTIVQAVSHEGHTLLSCEENGVRFQAWIIGDRELEELWNWIGVQVELVGALGVTLESGSENKDPKTVVRNIECLRICCSEAPEIVPKKEPKPEASNSDQPDRIFLQGQVTEKLDDSFILLDSQKSTRIYCEDLYAIHVASVVRIAAIAMANPSTDMEYQAKAVEEQFSTRLPNPIDFDEVIQGNRLWKFVKVAGRPIRIRQNENRVFFEVHRNGKNALVELRDHGIKNHHILANTRYLEVQGIIIDADPNGDCHVLVKTKEHISLIESVVPIWKYLTWVLLPITSLFLIGFIWVKAQRNRADSHAASIKLMHNRLVSTCQSINDAMLAVDSGDRVLIANSQFCELIGRELQPGEQFDIGTCLEFLGRVKDRTKIEKFIFGHDCESNTADHLEIEINEPEVRSYDMSCSNIVPENGESSGRLLILRDRTSERQLQAELIHSNKLEAVGQLVGGIAHDFNNILATIQANLSLLDLDSKLEPETKEKIEDVNFAATRGAEMVRRLLTYSGKGELRPQVHSINSIIRELHKFTKAMFDARYQFDFELDPEEPPVHADSGAIEQVLLNIYLNARDAMPNGGTISTQTKVISGDQNGWVQIRITDTGPGIPKEIQGRIFDPFFTTKAGQAGTGLGLSTSKRLILEQNGRLECTSTDKSDCCFEIALPITQGVEASSPEKKSKPEIPVCQTEKKTVLVVDDEDGIRKVASVILEMHGFEAITAVSGKAALDVLKTEHQRIGMVLLDMTMPGISGLDVLKIASVEYPDIPVVMCSGYLAGVSNEIEDNCLMLSKPFSAQELIAMVGQAVNVDPVVTEQ